MKNNYQMKTLINAVVNLCVNLQYVYWSSASANLFVVRQHEMNPLDKKYTA